MYYENNHWFARGIAFKSLKLTKSKTKVEAIKKALQEMINLEERKKIINVRGKIDLDVLRDRQVIA